MSLAAGDILLSPQQAARRLGFPRQRVWRLIDYGKLEAHQLSGPSYWKIPLSSVLACEERRAESDRRTAEWSRELDAMGAPPE